MINFDQALRIVHESVVLSARTEMVPLVQSYGRILATDVLSDVDMPPFDKSAMDGYACRKSDIAAPLVVIEVIPAGYVPQQTIQKGQCAKIMTGAIIPQGADCVVMVENTETQADGTVKVLQHTSDNICLKGEDVKAGQKVLRAGTRVDARHIAVLAAVGYSQVPVFEPVKVGIIATGSELVEPDTIPHASAIRNSNGHQLIAQVQAVGATPIYAGIGSDNPESLKTLIQLTLQQCDVLLLTGGVSVGDFDYVPQILNELGIEMVFHGLHVRPGKRLAFARGHGKYVFGLPGNPVSTYIQFDLLVKSLVFGLTGCRYTPVQMATTLAAGYKQKNAKTINIIPVAFTPQGNVQPIEYHGSAHIASLTDADGYIMVPQNVYELNIGDTVYVRPF